MDLEKIIREFLAIIDFKLCSIANGQINIQDIKNTNELNQILMLPIDYKSNDDLRVFKSSELNNGCYYINVLNTKYPDVPFSKNGIDNFDIRMIKDNEKDCFSSEIYNNDSIYINSIGKILHHNFLSYRKIDNNEILINVSYAVDGNNRSLELSSNFSKKNDRKLCIKENNEQHGAILIVKENNQEFYKQSIKSNEIDNYFQALVYRLKDIIEQSNNVIRTLNNNIFEMVFNYYNIGTEFLNMIDNSISSNEIIDSLFEKYFSNIPLNKKIEPEISYQKTLILSGLRKNISKN